MPGGAPTDYRVEFCQKACKLAEQGATDREVAEALDVSERTLYRWKHEHEAFRQAIKLGKEAADDRVEQSLYRRAVGYSFDAVKINVHLGSAVVTPYTEHVPPDVTAASLWLRNRRPEKWRDKIDHAHSGSIAVKTSEMTDEQLAEIARAGVAASA